MDSFRQSVCSNGLAQSALCHHVDMPSEQLLQAYLQPRQVQQSSARLKRDEEVDVAIVTFFTPGHGPENPYLPDSVRGGSSMDILPQGGNTVLDSHGTNNLQPPLDTGQVLIGVDAG
jgi:hypothetical protein